MPSIGPTTNPTNEPCPWCGQADHVRRTTSPPTVDAYTCDNCATDWAKPTHLLRAVPGPDLA